jgi:hypothetical protein
LKLTPFHFIFPAAHIWSIAIPAEIFAGSQRKGISMLGQSSQHGSAGPSWAAEMRSMATQGGKRDSLHDD